ncbi:hypothetical protein B0H19DRAFT_25476 [Mycena capillaripes]|nr:hypothetical protein B0H19DRAFT_25476 [Mycena capillaripes]
MQGANVTGSPDINKAFGTQLVYRSSLGALTFLAYDICITLDDEVKFVWPKPWTRMKLCYLFIRYVPLFVQISTLFIASPELTPHFNFTPHDCFIWQVYQGVATVLLFAAVDYVLILRVSALYHNNATIRKFVLAAFILEIAGMCVGLGLSLPTIQFDEICLVTAISPTLIVYAGATLLFQTLLFGLTLAKFVRAVRDGWGDTPLVGLVMRDGTWAFILLFGEAYMLYCDFWLKRPAVIAGDASLYGLKNHTIAGVLYGCVNSRNDSSCFNPDLSRWLLSVFSFSGYHVLLNLDRLSDAPYLPTSQTSTNQSSLQFTTRIITDRDAAHHSYELSRLNARAGTGG